MSEYLTSLVMRAHAPELSVRPRSSSRFDRPGRAPGWEVSAPNFEVQPPHQRMADEEEAGAAPVNGSVRRRASAAAVAAVGRHQRPQSPTVETRAVDPAETAAVDGAAGRRASATVAATDQEHLRSSLIFETRAIDPADTEQPAAVPHRSMMARPALTANSVRTTDKVRAGDRAVSGDTGAHAAARRADRAQGDARTSSRESSLPTDGSEIREVPDQSKDQSSEARTGLHAALQRSDGVRSNRGQAAPLRPDPRSRFGDGLSTAPFAAAGLNGVFPREQSENDPGRGEAIEPGLARQIRRIEVSQQSEAVRRDGSASGQPPVHATNSRSAETPTLRPTHAPLGAFSRREGEPRDRQAAPVSPSTIQVTIGRIEVRATTAAEPRTKPRPASASTSLDDYLRQRSGRSGS
jgi:hypothetical protein